MDMEERTQAAGLARRMVESHGKWGMCAGGDEPPMAGFRAAEVLLTHRMVNLAQFVLALFDDGSEPPEDGGLSREKGRLVPARWFAHGDPLRSCRFVLAEHDRHPLGPADLFKNTPHDDFLMSGLRLARTISPLLEKTAGPGGVALCEAVFDRWDGDAGVICDQGLDLSDFHPGAAFRGCVGLDADGNVPDTATPDDGLVLNLRPWQADDMARALVNGVRPVFFVERGWA